MSDQRLFQVIQRLIQVPRSRVKPGGFPEDIFLNLAPDWQERLQCSICFLVLKDPRQCINGHKYCWCCIHVWSVSGHSANYSTCPVCRVEGAYTVSKLEDDEILNFNVKCHLKDCTWTGILRLQRSHEHQPKASVDKGTGAHGAAKPVDLPRSPNSPEVPAAPGSPGSPPHTATGLPVPSSCGFIAPPNSLSQPSQLAFDSPTTPSASTTFPDITPPPGVRPNPAYVRSVPVQGNERASPPSGTELDRELSRTLGNVTSGYLSVMQDSRARLNDILHTFRQRLARQEEEATSFLEDRQPRRQELLEERRQLSLRLVAARLRTACGESPDSPPPDSSD